MEADDVAKSKWYVSNSFCLAMFLEINSSLLSRVISDSVMLAKVYLSAFSELCFADLVNWTFTFFAASSLFFQQNYTGVPALEMKVSTMVLFPDIMISS